MILNPEQGGVEFGVPSLGSCVPSTEELYLHVFHYLVVTEKTPIYFELN